MVHPEAPDSLNQHTCTNPPTRIEKTSVNRLKGQVSTQTQIQMCDEHAVACACAQD